MPDNMTDALIESSISVSSLGNECFICYEDMSDGNDIMKLPCCKKELHEECLEKWQESKNFQCKCPHCNQVFYSKNKEKEENLIYENEDNSVIIQENRIVKNLNCTKCYGISIYVFYWLFFILITYYLLIM